ncbi:unnamed protein product [Arctogadus glacialis]
MSVLEDVLDLLRTVLEYFGVPKEMLVPGWDSELCGQYRSIVRMIGTNIPMTPTPRVHFQIPLHTYRSHGYVDVTMDTHAIPSFADVLWLAEDDGDSLTQIRNRLPPSNQSVVHRDIVGRPVRLPSRAHSRAPLLGQNSDPEALRKITFLEDELLKLRAQIAIIVTAPQGLTPAQTLLGTHSLSPQLTSTPRSAPPPPPPPPPLPPPSSGPGAPDETLPLSHLIRQRRLANNAQGNNPAQGSVSAKAMPSMLDVLKDLNSVTLRSVKRSPGGRPVKPRRSGGKSPALPSDPASLIAEALRRKFALHNTSDKENSMESSPFGSPESPRVIQPSRRSRGRLHL